MSTVNKENSQYALFRDSKSNRTTFIKVVDDEAIEAFRAQCHNTDIMVSICLYGAVDLSAPRTYSLYFHIVSESLEKTRVATLEAVYYVPDRFKIPQDCIEIIYTGSCGINNPAIYNDAADATCSTGGHDSSGTAEMVILIPPVVFGGGPTPFMPELNYELARQLTDLIIHVDVDLYQRDHCIRLPNSINSSAAGRYVIPLQQKELLYLDSSTIAELAKKPRAEDSLVMSQRTPQAVQWYFEILEQFENKKNKENQLLQAMLKTGWQVPSCIRRLLRANLDNNTAGEVYRIITQFFAWIKASPDEIWHIVQSMNRRNSILDYHRLNSITVFGIENPGIVDCKHPLLKQFCPPGKCLIKELIDAFESPRLFDKKKIEDGFIRS